MKPKSLGFHRTKAANNEIQQANALIFARHPIGVTYNQLSAMLAGVIHNYSVGAKNMPYWLDFSLQQMSAFNGFQKDFLSNNAKYVSESVLDMKGNTVAFLNRGKRITYKLGRYFQVGFL